MEEERDKEEKVVLMWGYFSGVSSQRLPLLSLAVVRMPPEYSAGDSWRDISGGGGFTMAVSESGKLFTWGSTDDMGQRRSLKRFLFRLSESAAHVRDWTPAAAKENKSLGREVYKVTGTCVKAIACGGRHSAVITGKVPDTGAVLTFGWGLYGPCGLGNTDDKLTPLCVSSLLGVKMRGIAAVLWHTLCTSAMLLEVISLASWELVLIRLRGKSQEIENYRTSTEAWRLCPTRQST